MNVVDKGIIICYLHKYIYKYIYSASTSKKTVATIMEKNLKDQIYTKIKRDILLCKLRPGDRLFDKDLAEQMQVSRTPAREALLLLTSDRLLTAESRSGFIVRRISMTEIQQFFDIRERLVDYTAELLIKYAKPEDIAVLESCATLSEECYAQDRMEDYVLACADFHKALGDATHCEIYVRVMDNLNDIMTLFRAMTIGIPNSVDMSIKEHRGIVDAIKSYNLAAVKNALLSHLDGPRANMRILAGVI